MASWSALGVPLSNLEAVQRCEGGAGPGSDRGSVAQRWAGTGSAGGGDVQGSDGRGGSERLQWQVRGSRAVP